MLARRRVAVTRTGEQADALCAALEAAGAEPVRTPTIRFAPPPSYAQLDAALGALSEFEWVVFTSANGVRAALERAAEIGVATAAIATRRLAAVGGSTAGALAARGLTASFVPAGEAAGELARGIPDVAGRRVLLARGDRGDPALGRILSDRGALVESVTAYVTIPVPPSGQGLEELSIGVDAITFTSPSTVTGFVSLGPDWRGLVRRAVVATIGPTTTAAAMTSGLGVHAEAKERTNAGLVEAVAAALTMGARAKNHLPW
jgi:uroporphyrinogen III methyltransferase/synthase